MSRAAQAAEQHYREVVTRMMQAALDAVDPEKALLKAVRRNGSRLEVGSTAYDLDAVDRVVLVGGGKAGAPMAKAMGQIVGDRLYACVVNVKRGYTLPAADLESMQAACACPVTFVEAGHPTPDESGVAGARAMVDALSGLTERDLVLCVISGGGSALMTVPAEGVSLADMQALTELLLRSGATINEMNCVRKHLEQLKGGGMARLARPAGVVAAILSDVVGNPLDVIASGPTVPDTTTFPDAWRVLTKYDLIAAAPPAVVSRLKRGLEGTIADTPKPGDPLFDRVQTIVVGSNDIAATAAVEQARREGLNALLLSTYVEGEAREVARVAAALAKDMAANDRPLAKPACLVLGGETTVTIRGQGLGGRNQELALAGAIALADWDGVMLATLATDGTDGPTDAAGGVVTGQTVARAREMGLDPQASLRNNDSYRFLRQTGEILLTGPTNTNVNDLTFVLAY